MTITDCINKLIRMCKTNRRLILTVLASIIVVIVTYSLVLPAMTLEKDKAAEQGGITVEENAEAVNMENADPEADDAEPETDDAGIEADAAAVETDAENTEEDKPSGTLEYRGKGYRIEASFNEDAGFSENTELRVTLIDQDSNEYKGKYDEYLANIGKALESDGDFGFFRLYDISFVDTSADDEEAPEAADGREVEPDAPVCIRVEYDRKIPESARESLRIVHLTENGKSGKIKADLIDSDKVEVEKDAVTFKADSFSVYAIVDAPEPVTVTPVTVQDLNELSQNTDTPFIMSVAYNNTSYFTNSLTSNTNAFVVTRNISSASEFFMEAVPGQQNQYYIYTMVDGSKKYVRNTSGNLVGFADSNVEVSQADTEKFYVKVRGENKWLQYSGSGSGIRFWTDNNNATNSQISFTYASSLVPPDDPYGLNGKSYGIAYHNGEVSATGVTSTGKTASNQSRLAGEKLTIKPDILDNDGILLIKDQRDMVEWTFENVSGDVYHIKTTVNGADKYLTISGNNVTLEDEPAENGNSNIKVTPGTGDNSGKYHFTVNGYSLNLVSGDFNAATGTGANTWLNLTEKSQDITDDDFVIYTAHKVSVSDRVKMPDGQKVVIYTRIWNEDTLRYDFYAVDYNGSLVKVYESGDMIRWESISVNTLLWDFTEYYFDDGVTPNYYYEFQNEYSGRYIAPQMKGEQILSDDTIGVNLNGRRDGRTYSTIVAWDDRYYDYSGLKIEDGKVVPCPIDEADDFYFAVMTENEGGDDKLSTVDTIDSNAYGISMKMIDFNGQIVNEREVQQTAFFGRDSNSAGLLSTNLVEGYPSTTSLTPEGGRPLSELFQASQLTPVNHLFLNSIYNESGYFEYDSTKNFAHLNPDGTFKVYDQLAAIGQMVRETRTHGQFMPYNDIQEGVFATDTSGNYITNQTDVNANPLPDTDPRKGEKLYLIPQNQADYFFGMEMEANFTQTIGGVDERGHDIIFEFSGDDDFWFYVDGELVLDLGGVHSAMTGSINFRTGTVKSSRSINIITGKRADGTFVTAARTQYTLREIFKSNYWSRNPDATEAEVNAHLDGIFKDGGTVFKDYTNHDMKMFYMERGSGASNLYMRFNLSAVKPGTVLLNKKLTGVEEGSVTAEFPYQIYYRLGEDPEGTFHLLPEKTEDKYNVLYDGTSMPVTYESSFTPAHCTQPYTNVFFLKPDDTAEINLPPGTVEYYIVECGVNHRVFDTVKMNGKSHEDSGSELVQRPAQGAQGPVFDYRTTPASPKDRPKVNYENNVREGVLRTLSFTKQLWDVDGVTRITDDPTPFDFRLYIGSENTVPPVLAEEGDIVTPAANIQPYHVKDKNGNYCRWDPDSQSFISLNKTSYSDLTDEEKRKATFRTSPNGSISRIPVDYTVEVRQVLVGTKFEVEEREEEIPKGYSLKDYYRDGHGNNRVPAGEAEQAGMVHENTDPKVIVNNYRGWGLTAEKIWTDKDFMSGRDTIYFAVFGKNGNDLELIDGTVRKMAYTDSNSLYWYFDKLQEKSSGGSFTFRDYVVREVTISGTDPQYDEDGYVTDYGTVTPVDEGETLTINAVPSYSGQSGSYEYTASYEAGEISGANNNIRTDTVTNSRPGIRITKTNWAGDPLRGATFTLKDEGGNNVGTSETFVSDREGFVTTAYLPQGTFTLTETKTPLGFKGLDSPLLITMDGSSCTVAGGESDNEAWTYEESPSDGGMPLITVKNRSYILKAVKQDGGTGQPLPDVKFSLYKQVKNSSGTPRKDVRPIEGFEELITDEQGVIPGINQELKAGTYYLSEIIPPEGYGMLNGDVIFTITPDGIVRLEDGSEGSLRTEKQQGQQSYTISVLNYNSKAKVRFLKVDIANTDLPLQGAVFDLYVVIDGERADEPRYTGLTSDSQGYLVYEGETEFELGAGVYQLVETAAPEGYQLRSDPVVITITEQAGGGSTVIYDDGTSLSQSGEGMSFDTESETYTLKISNESGIELPNAGGPGTTWIYLTGTLLALGCGIMLAARLRAQKR